MPKKKRTQGHYCKICGQYKAHEKFSGKGHASHICKACSRLSPEEKAEAMTVNRLMNFPMRRLTDSERKWLEARMHDSRQDVADMAREVYRECFPHAERNAMKKRLLINTLSFEIHMEVYDGYGDMERVDRRFKVDRKRNTLTMEDFHAGGVETSVTLQGGQMAKLLRYIVHTLEIFMWEQDYLLVSNSGADTDIWLEEKSDMDGMEEKQEFEKEPYWHAYVEYADHTSQNIDCYENDLPERPEELYFSLMEYFEPEDEEFEDDVF